MANRNEQRDCRATDEGRDGAAERNEIERRDVIEKAAEKPPDEYDAKRPARQAASHPPRTLSKHESGNGARV